jgi:hypothetical protein
MLAARKLAARPSLRATGTVIRSVTFAFGFIKRLPHFQGSGRATLPPCQQYTIYTVMQINV